MAGRAEDHKPLGLAVGKILQLPYHHIVMEVERKGGKDPRDVLYKRERVRIDKVWLWPY